MVMDPNSFEFLIQIYIHTHNASVQLREIIMPLKRKSLLSALPYISVKKNLKFPQQQKQQYMLRLQQSLCNSHQFPVRLQLSSPLTLIENGHIKPELSSHFDEGSLAFAAWPLSLQLFRKCPTSRRDFLFIGLYGNLTGLLPHLRSGTYGEVTVNVKSC